MNLSSNAILLVSTQGPELQNLITTRVASMSGRVDLLPDGSQFFKQLSERSYALLIIDLSLWVKLIQSDSFFTEIKSTSFNPAILLLAAEVERNQAIEQLQRGAADYLLLPINPIELSSKIEHLLSVQALRRGSPPMALSGSADRQLLLLYEASQEISRTSQLDEVLKLVLTKARHITGANLAKIYLTSRNGNLSRDQSLANSSARAGQAGEEDLLFSLAEQAAFTEEIVCVQKNSTPDWPDQAVQSALVIPLISREKLVGVLALGRTSAQNFAADQIQWLSIFCAQAATIIENANLVQDLSSTYINLAKNREQVIGSQHTLQALFDSITDGLYLLDQDLILRAVNQVEAERHGYQPAEMVGQSWLSLNWVKAAPALLERVNESLQTGRETTWISPENETEPHLKDKEFRIYPIRNRLAEIEQVIVFAQDVSERRRWQVSLFRSANLAAVGQLAGSVAHQINNPLTITMTNSQLLMLEAGLGSEAQELVTDIFRAGERIQKIVTNLLEFSNQETYFFTRIDLIDTIEDALALVIRPLKKARIKVVKDYQAQTILSASVSHLKLVWMNLLLNARDALVDCPDQPQITISTRFVSDREVKVAINDNGRGIAEKDFEQLFRPFFTTKPVGRGLGLSLYSAHTIIERHNGQIKAFSQPGLVTTFEVILPLDNPRDL